MKKRFKVVMIFILFLLILAVGWLFVMRTYTIADFAEVEWGMTPQEVIQIVGRPSSQRGMRYAGNYSYMVYNLNDGSKIGLSFFRKTHLSTIRLSDTSGRIFVLYMLDSDRFKDNETRKHENRFKIANFTNIEHGMSYTEVMELLGIPLEDTHVLNSNCIVEVFNLGNETEMRLVFFERDELISMRIVDPIGRVFMISEEFKSLGEMHDSRRISMMEDIILIPEPYREQLRDRERE